LCPIMQFRDRQGRKPASVALADESERERLHRQIFSSVSHDLKTPLASIIGSLEIYERMNERLSDSQRRGLISVALQESYRLDNFITNILDMAKLENGLVKLRKEMTAIDTLLDDCVTRLGNRLKGSEIHIERPPQALTVMTDSVLLARAICLVLDNAVKFGGTPPEITISYGKADDGRGYIDIIDNGKGVPDGRTEEIFQKYTRFAHGDQQNAGTGLGLAICRQIMQLLGGDVSVADSAQGGAIFTLHVPCA